MNTLNTKDFKTIICRISATMVENKDKLIQLDSVFGDGDLGLTMEKGFESACMEAQSLVEPDIGKLSMRIGAAIARSAPSTMGTLVATGFMNGGKSVLGKQELNLEDIASFFKGFTDGVASRGKASPGDKTLLDVLAPASQALTDAVKCNMNFQDALRLCKQSVMKGVAASSDMVAKHGRAAYYGDQSRGKVDPGAVAASYILDGFIAYVLDNSDTCHG